MTPSAVLACPTPLYPAPPSCVGHMPHARASHVEFDQTTLRPHTEGRVPSGAGLVLTGGTRGTHFPCSGKAGRDLPGQDHVSPFRPLPQCNTVHLVIQVCSPVAAVACAPVTAAADAPLS